MKFTGERVIEGETPARIWSDHIARYEFAGGYVEGKSVLDIACGTGYGCDFFIRNGARHVIGMDISEEAITFARTKYKVNRLQFEVGDISDINLPESPLDLITCFETIEHIENQQIALSQLWRVLKPGGILIISSPNRRLTSPGTFSNDQPDNRFHTREYSTQEFVSTLQGYFDVLQVCGQRAKSKLLLLPLLQRIMRRIIPALYAPGRASPKVERVSLLSEYRYITAVCRKRGES